MARPAQLIFLYAVLVSAAMAHQLLTLEVGEERFGAFTSLTQDREASGTVTLEQGWITTAFLGLWWPEFGGGLAPGHHRFPPECVGRRLEVTQVLAPDARGRLRSWTLMDACPLACEVESQDGEKINVTSLTLRVQGVGVAL
jgi:hypothetical protein